MQTFKATLKKIIDGKVVKSLTWIQHFHILCSVITQPLIQLQAFPQQNYYLTENLTHILILLHQATLFKHYK